MPLQKMTRPQLALAAVPVSYTHLATSFKGPKEKSRNYITYTKASLKKGTKYQFQCGVVIKDKDGKVVAEKSYKASTVGSRICR